MHKTTWSLETRVVRTMGASFWGTWIFALAGCSADVGSLDPYGSEATSSASQAVANKNTDTIHQDTDDPGQIESDSTNAFAAGTTNGFFANLGTNGRTCNTCHVQADGWSFTPSEARGLSSSNPLFSPNDGSDCPPARATQAPNKAISTEVTNYGLIRIQIGIPTGANFSLVSASNPKACSIAPGSSGVGGQLFMFRRPLPSTNLIFDSAVMWDGRETLEKPDTIAGEQGESALLFDLADQANGATLGHAQGTTSIAGTQTQTDIVTFETNVYTAQSLMQFQHITLSADGANGGSQYLADTTAPAFFIGVNDPLQAGFTNADFNIFAAWEPTSPTYKSLKKSEQSIGRGEALFNNTTFTIHDVPGLNSVPSDPLYNPGDPLAGADIVGGCAVCHNSPNVGNHSTALAINIGVTMAQPTNNDGSANNVLDVANLPVYTLANGAASVAVTDPGKALVSGQFVDIGKTKGPILRGLSSRAPYFHNGSAADLATVVAFYDQRFAIGLTAAQQADLVAFLQAL
jgi:cytochrome c peroxidase